MIYIIIALFIIRLKATNNLQRFKYKNDIKQYLTEMLKKTTYTEKLKPFLCNGSTTRTLPPFICTT